MSIVRRAVPVLVVLSLVAVPLLAQSAPPEPPEEVQLNALVQEALAKNPDVLEAAEAVTAARARPNQVQGLPDPTVSFNYTNDGWSPTLGEREMTTLGVMGTQVLTWPGKRRLRGEVAALGADQAALRAERVRLSLAAAVKRAYWGLLLARQLQAVTGEQEAIWRQIEGVTRARYGVGQGAQQDVLRVQVELTRVQQLRAEQNAEEHVRLAEIGRLLARDPGTPLETGDQIALVKEPRERGEILAQVEEASPELRAATTAIAQDRLLVDLAEKEPRPDFAVQAGYMNRGHLDPMWQAGVAFGLPLHRRRFAGARAEAEARTRGSERRLDSMRLELRFRTEERLTQMETAETLARLYGDGIIPQDRMSVEAAVASYQAGRVPFVAVLEALATLYDDRFTHLRVLAGHARARASLEEASLEAASDPPWAGGRENRAAGGPMGGVPAPAAGAMTGMGK